MCRAPGFRARNGTHRALSGRNVFRDISLLKNHQAAMAAELTTQPAGNYFPDIRGVGVIPLRCSPACVIFITLRLRKSATVLNYAALSDLVRVMLDTVQVTFLPGGKKP
jgi:hypothetical protein